MMKYVPSMFLAILATAAAVQEGCREFANCRTCLSEPGSASNCVWFAGLESSGCIAEDLCDTKEYEGGRCHKTEERKKKFVRQQCKAARQTTTENVNQATKAPIVLADDNKRPGAGFEFPDMLGMSPDEADLYLENAYGGYYYTEVIVEGEAWSKDLRNDRVRLHVDKETEQTIIQTPTVG